ncbi:MAG: cupin domain-containing protein [Gammaproteobacteria bacterium]|nr:cupin domain-containing protein [Gammaproteobacteria bacterium]
MVKSLTGLGIVLSVGISFSTILFAAEANGPTTIPLSQLEADQEMRILTVDLAPGQASQPHRHNAYVFVYVLEGIVEMQVLGGPLMQLGPGDMFFENPDDIHQVSRNASNIETAKFLVHMLKKEGEPVTVQINN